MLKYYWFPWLWLEYYFNKSVSSGNKVWTVITKLHKIDTNLTINHKETKSCQRNLSKYGKFCSFQELLNCCRVTHKFRCTSSVSRLWLSMCLNLINILVITIKWKSCIYDTQNILYLSRLHTTNASWWALRGEL